MAGDWSTVSIEDIKSPNAHAIAMGPFGSDIKTDNFVPSGVPVIRGVNLSTGRFNDDDFVFLTDQKADELRSANAYPGDIIFTHRGTLGQVGIIPHNARHPRYVVSQSQMKLSCDTKKVDPLFVFYFFRSPSGQHALLANTSTTGVPAISRPLTSLKSIRLPLPNITEQHAIAHFLDALDDKIELNRQMNETLEAIARAIFKSWFVDFDPVRAKMEGCKTSGMDAETAALFPDSLEDSVLEDSVLGEIPQGWRIGTLEDIAEIEMGQSPPGETYNELGEGLPFYQGIRDFGYRFPMRRVYCTAATRLADRGDILLSVRAPVGSLNIATEYCGIGRGLAALRAKNELGSFLFSLMKATQYKWEMFEGEGTVFGSVTKAGVHSFSIIIPPQEIIELFCQLVNPIDTKVELNENESITLTAIRNTLLPKLLSGRIRIKEAEKYVETHL